MSGDPTPEFYAWDAAGRPFTVCRPVTELYTWIGAQGIVRLGTLGNEEHLRNPLPQDHTPYSYTARPWPLPGYVVTACDAANEVRNNISLGAGCLAEARAGRMPWLKYMNFDGMQYRYEDGFQVGRPNSDRHCHFSARTDQLGTGLDPNFNPFGTGAPMSFLTTAPPDGVDNGEYLACRVEQILHMRSVAPDWAINKGEINDFVKFLLALDAKIDQMNAKLDTLLARPSGGGGTGGGNQDVLDAMASAAEAAAGVLRDAAGGE